MIFLLIAVQVSRSTYGSIGNLVEYGISLFIGGVLIGIFFGILSISWMKIINYDNTLTINVTIVLAYITYFVAENIQLGFAANGLISVITLGM